MRRVLGFSKGRRRKTRGKSGDDILHCNGGDFFILRLDSDDLLAIRLPTVWVCLAEESDHICADTCRKMHHSGIVTDDNFTETE